MRVQPKSTASESELSRADRARGGGESFSEFLAQSSKTAQNDPAEIAQRRAITSEKQHEANESSQPSVYTRSDKHASTKESSAKGCVIDKIGAQSEQSTCKENSQRGQPTNEAAKGDTDEVQPSIPPEAERDQKSTTPEHAQQIAQQNELTAVPAKTAAIELTASASAADADTDSVETASTHGSVQTATGANDAQQALKAASTLQDEISNREAADPQQAEPNALQEELGIGNLDVTVDHMALQSLASQSSTQSQPCADSADGNQQGSADQGSSALAQTNTEQTAAFDLTNLKAPASGECAVSALTATGGDTGVAHTNSAANGSSDPAGHRTETDTTPLGAGILQTDLVNALQTAMVPQHIESQQVGAVNSMLTDSGTAAQTAAAAGDTMTDQNNGSKLAGMSGISTAQLIHTLRDSEMRVGIHLNEFGAVSIRTTVSDQQMQTQIAVEHGELGSTLAAHIPLMQQKLASDFGLQASIEVNANGAGFTGNGQHTSQQQTVAPAMVRMQPQDSTTEISIVQMPVAADSTYRLDIRA